MNSKINIEYAIKKGYVGRYFNDKELEKNSIQEIQEYIGKNPFKKAIAYLKNINLSMIVKNKMKDTEQYKQLMNRWSNEIGAGYVEA